MKYEMDEKKWGAVKGYLNKVWKDPDRYPDKGLLISLSDGEATKIFTRARLQIIKMLAHKKIKSMSELSNMLGRMLSAVKRDLELLQSFNIVKLERRGKNIIPVLVKELLIIPLVSLKSKNLAEIKALA